MSPSDYPTAPDHEVPEPYDGQEAPLGAPQWFREALDELRSERSEMVQALRETLAEVKLRDERMMTLLENTLNQALANETRLNRVEDKASANELAIAQLRSDLAKLMRLP